METFPGVTFDIQLEIRNEITGQPHIHYYTIDRQAAQAFYYMAESVFGEGKLVFKAHSDLREGDYIPCIPCREGGDFSSELYRARSVPEVRT